MRRNLMNCAKRSKCGSRCPNADCSMNSHKANLLALAGDWYIRCARLAKVLAPANVCRREAQIWERKPQTCRSENCSKLCLESASGKCKLQTEKSKSSATVTRAIESNAENDWRKHFCVNFTFTAEQLKMFYTKRFKNGKHCSGDDCF